MSKQSDKEQTVEFECIETGLAHIASIRWTTGHSTLGTSRLRATSTVLTRSCYRSPGMNLARDSVVRTVCAASPRQILIVRRLPRRRHFGHHAVFRRRVFADVRDPRMPFWRNLRCIVLVLSKVNPSVSSWNLFFCVQVFIVAIPKIVGSYKSPRLCITNILQLSPPFSKPDPPKVPNCPRQRHHVSVDRSPSSIDFFNYSGSFRRSQDDSVESR